VTTAKAPKTTRRTARQRDSRPSVGRRVLKFGLAFVACALLLNALVGARGLPAVLQARREHRAMAADLERLRGENDRLRQHVRRLREDPAAIEELARRELGLIKPGEKLFIIADAPAADARASRR
jgi:cell division protein FtsB